MLTVVLQDSAVKTCDAPVRFLSLFLSLISEKFLCLAEYLYAQILDDSSYTSFIVSLKLISAKPPLFC